MTLIFICIARPELSKRFYKTYIQIIVSVIWGVIWNVILSDAGGECRENCHRPHLHTCLMQISINRWQASLNHDIYLDDITTISTHLLMARWRLWLVDSVASRRSRDQSRDPWMTPTIMQLTGWPGGPGTPTGSLAVELPQSGTYIWRHGALALSLIVVLSLVS